MKKLTTLLRHFAGVSAFAAALCLALPSALAGPGAAGGGASSDDPSDGDDDIGTLPSLAEDTLPSLVFIGSLGQIQSVLFDVSGSGKMTVQSMGSGLWAAVFDGDVNVHVDLPTFAQSGVLALVSTGPVFAGGIASIYAGGTWSGPMSLDTLTASTGLVALPLEAIGALGTPVSLKAQSPDSDLYTLRMFGGGDILTLSQRLIPAPLRNAVGL